jgi:hypothetical protein
VSRIFLAKAIPRNREGLAGVSGDEEPRQRSRELTNESSEARIVERGNVIPDRRSIQGLVFHPAHEAGRRFGLSLNITNGS